MLLRVTTVFDFSKKSGDVISIISFSRVQVPTLLFFSASSRASHASGKHLRFTPRSLLNRSVSARFPANRRDALPGFNASRLFVACGLQRV